jgi:hypothetical protein
LKHQQSSSTRLAKVGLSIRQAEIHQPQGEFHDFPRPWKKRVLWKSVAESAAI